MLWNLILTTSPNHYNQKVDQKSQRDILIEIVFYINPSI